MKKYVKEKVAVSIFLFLLLKCSCLILSTWSLLLMTWHSLVFLWNSSFQYLWHSSALICFWLDIWRALHSQKTNAIDGWASVPSWIFSFTTIRVQFSVSLQVTFISSHLSALMIIKFFMKTNLQLNLSQIAFYKLLLIFTQKLSTLLIFPSKLSWYVRGGFNTFIMRWTVNLRRKHTFLKGIEWLSVVNVCLWIQ